MNKSLDTLQKTVDHYCAQLAEQASDFSQADTLLELKQELADKIARFSADEQRLSIGIMGQVKAGKSTFLNALLFNGEPVLPEAATPKTANLTRITYGTEPKLVVEYYELEEWKALEQKAASAEDNAQTKVARELMTLAKEQGLNAAAKLRQGSAETITAASSDELLTLLNQYVGENGRYTALVKMTHLYLPREELRGFEVVDTPGMNDPIQSRTQKTRDYMAECDVVFFLSRASQFLDSSDMELVSQQLPGKGVKRMVLVAGQFDSALLDDGYDRDSLAETEQNLLTRLGRAANAKINDLVEQREHRGQTEIAAMLRQMSTPLFASTFAYGFASWPKETWSKAMRHCHGELAEMAKDCWNGYQFTEEDWLRIGNFSALQAAYLQARDDRQPLLDAQRNGIASHTAEQWQQRIQILEETVQRHQHQLQTGDLASLQQQQKTCEQRIGNFDTLLQQHIRQNQSKIATAATQLIQELQAQAGEYQELHTRTGTKTIRTSREVSTSSWYNPFSWGRTETVWSSYQESYQYASVADAAEQVRQYADRCRLDIEHNFNKLINPRMLKNELKASLIEVISTKSENFDPNSFRSILDHSLEQLQLPKLVLNTGNMSQIISSQFQGEVKQDQIEELRRTLASALQQVFSHLSQSVKQGERELVDSLSTISATLAKRLNEDVCHDLNKVKQDFGQCQQRLEHYKKLLNSLEKMRAL